MAVRLQKFLATAGLGSRREIEGWIREELIRLNGKKAVLGDQVKEGDDLTVKGRFHKVVMQDGFNRKVLVYHKPEGEITSRADTEGRRTVFDRLPQLQNSRWIAVGRLDINSLGLLIFTTDGQLANALMHPSSEVVRKYAVRVNGQVTDEMLENMRQGVELDDGVASFDSIIHTGGDRSNQWYDVSLKEGRNREVRRLFASQDLMVSRLIRVQYGPVHLPKWLGRGKFADLDERSLKALLKSVNIDEKASDDDKLKLVSVHPRHKRRSKKR